VTNYQAFAQAMKKTDICMRIARLVLLLQDFHYTIEHLSERNMRHVDALSTTIGNPNNGVPRHYTCKIIKEPDGRRRTNNH